MMFLLSHHGCFFVVLCISATSAIKMMRKTKSLRMFITPKRLHTFETPVTLTLYLSSARSLGNITRVIKVNILRQYENVFSINTMSPFNYATLEVPCETFSRPGKYYVEYFIQGITETFRRWRQKIVVREEKVRLNTPRNHTAVSGSVAAWIVGNGKRCKPYKGKVQLYWIRGDDDHVLVKTKEISRAGKGRKRFGARFRCDVFDTEGVFYFRYISAYSNRTVAESKAMTVSWGNYKMTAQSKKIFPCTSSFAIKFNAPYCDEVEDRVEMRSKDFNNVIDSQTAYLGFRSVFFPCEAFKRHIRNYCFYYITKSRLTSKEKIQSEMCVPTLRNEAPSAGWSQWSSWGSCSSPTDCGPGRKFRIRFCTATRVLQSTNEKPHCSGPPMDSASCTLPTCNDNYRDCKSCRCVLTNPAGTIVSPEFLPSFSAKNKSNCHWIIRVHPDKKVKLWFDTMNLASNSVIHIMDGNDSNSELLEKITIRNQKITGDIQGSSNIVLIRYFFDRNLNVTNAGFQLSYASIEKSASHHSLAKSSSSSKKLARRIFIGIFAVMVFIMAGIFYAVFFKMRPKKNEAKPKTCFSQQASSFHTSTACMSESTVRSFFETQLSGDESVNNLSVPRANNNHRPNLSTVRLDNRSSMHFCPKCRRHSRRSSSDFADASSGAQWRVMVHNDSVCESVVQSAQDELREPQGYSRVYRLRRTSSLYEEPSEINFPLYI